jgi:heme O synthase-like polyprenyltransferase
MEVKNDGLMKRTHRRPLPAGLMSKRHALVFAAGTGVAGVLALYFQARCRPTLLAAWCACSTTSPPDTPGSHCRGPRR